VGIPRHLDGPLQIRPLPAPASQRSAEIIGRVKPNRLLAGDQEAVYLWMVARAGYAEYYTAHETHWIDLK